MYDSLGLSESPTKMASQSVKPLLQAHERDQQTDTRTDHNTQSVAISRI